MNLTIIADKDGHPVVKIESHRYVRVHTEHFHGPD